MLDAADVFWFPDDDLEFSGADIVALFRAFHTNALVLAQPALAAGSEFSHLITLSCPLTRLRYTNFVELMMPVMSAQIFHRILPILRQYPAAKGLDYCWHAFETEDRPAGRLGIAIMDDIQVGHRRKLNVELMGRLADRGVDVRQQRQTVLQIYRDVAERPVTTRSRPAIPGLIRAAATLLRHRNAWAAHNRQKVKAGLKDQFVFDFWKRKRVPPECRADQPVRPQASDCGG
jgi:hypothetical protein